MSGGVSATTLTAVSIATTMVSAAVSMYAQHEGQKAQEKSAKAAATYNAQVAENEAVTQKQLAQNEISKGVADMERQQRQAARAMGEMRAEMGASGNLSLLAESAAEHQYDSAVIASNAEQAAWQHQVGALNATNQKGLYDWQKANASSGRTGTYLGMGGTLLGGIGKGLGQYNEWQKEK